MKELLKKIDLFSDLTNQELEAVMAIAHREHYPKGSVVALEGSPCSSFFIIHAGRANLLETVAGQETPEVVLEKLDTFGQECLFRDQVQCPKVVAYEDLDIIRFNKDEFQNLAMRMPEIAGKMQRKVENLPQEEVESGKFFGMIASLENRLLVELNSAMMLLKEIDAKSADTIERVEKRSSGTIAWVESRTKDIENRISAEIMTVEKRSLETFDRVEKRAESLEERVSDTLDQVKVESAAVEKRVTTALEDGKRQAAQVVADLQKESAKIIEQAQKERRWVKKGWTIATSVFTLIVGVASYYGIKEFPDLRKEMSDINRFYDKMKTMEVDLDAASRDAKVIRHIVLDLGKIRQFSRMIDESPDTLNPEELKLISVSFEFYRDTIVKEYFNKYRDIDSDNLLETLDIFFKMTKKGEVKLKGEEAENITKIFMKKIISDISSRPPNDWQYRMKTKDNLIAFGQLLMDTNTLQYQDLIENLNARIKYEDPQKGKFIRYTLAETLMELQGGNEEIRLVFEEMLKDDNHWRKTVAARNLLRMGDRGQRAFLFQEIRKADQTGLRKAIMLAEMIKKNEVFSEKERNDVIQRLQKGHRDQETNKFTKLYVKHLLGEITSQASVDHSNIPR